MFGDNDSVVNIASVIHTKLYKHRIVLSFHRVREDITSGVMTLALLAGKNNPADIIFKHWGYQQVWKILQPILF